jgi:hypothetical protein
VNPAQTRRRGEKRGLGTRRRRARGTTITWRRVRTATREREKEEKEEGGKKKKHGLLSKVKNAFVPKPGGIGRTGNDDLVS